MRERSGMVTSDTNDLPRTPPTGDSGDEPGSQFPRGEPGTPAGEDSPVGIRIGRNPGNLGDGIADEGDITFPDTVPQPAQI